MRRVTAISAFILGLAAAPSLAQPAAEPSDAELRSAAIAVEKVQRINEAYSPKLRAAESGEEARRVEESANAEMRRALKEEGLSEDRFREIAAQAAADPALAERMRQQFRQGRDEVTQ